MNPNDRPQSTFAKITNFFRGNLKQPLTWKQSDEKDDWANKAVDALVKKLKVKPDGIKKLEDALKSRSSASECVTIPRSMDGRLQILQCKALPHVIYCRVWRWPDIRNHHELKEVPNCQFPFSKAKRSEEVCINPYHYERVESSGMLPPILVPRCSEFAPGFSKLPQQQINMPEIQNEPMPGNVTYENNQFTPSLNGYNVSPQYQSGPNSPLSTMVGQPNGYQNFLNQYPAMNETPSTPHQNDNFRYGQHQEGVVQVHYEEPEHWATVAYYELNCRVGEQFKCNTNSYSLTVDGFTQPLSTGSNRFCLGQLSNVSRNSTIEATRRHIGKGVNIYFQNNSLYLDCVSECPVFVQGPMANYLHNFPPNIVLKVPPTQHLKIFDNNEFANLLRQVVNEGFEQTYGLTKMCTIRISFVKGWGAQYHRQDITSTPCWIEIHLNGPLKWLDEVLTQMGSPLYNITSVS